MLSDRDISSLKTAIESHVNPHSKYYGKLLEWPEGLSNHYAIGLSDKYMFSPGGTFAVIPLANYSLKFTPTPALSPKLVIQRLIHSLDCFKTWDYGLLGWNCEHYARLVATNEALSYQVKFSPLAFLNNHGYNPDAVNVFTNYLRELGLNELIKSP